MAHMLIRQRLLEEGWLALAAEAIRQPGAGSAGLAALGALLGGQVRDEGQRAVLHGSARLAGCVIMSRRGCATRQLVRSTRVAWTVGPCALRSQAVSLGGWRLAARAARGVPADARGGSSAGTARAAVLRAGAAAAGAGAGGGAAGGAAAVPSSGAAGVRVCAAKVCSGWLLRGVVTGLGGGGGRRGGPVGELQRPGGGAGGRRFKAGHGCGARGGSRAGAAGPRPRAQRAGAAGGHGRLRGAWGEERARCADGLGGVAV